MLNDEIEQAKRLVNTDRLQITIGEIASMYSARELNIIPEFQRLFRWSPEKKSNFVESILIGIPIPPAFAYENEDATWELIDGLQRISTILEFMGLLRDPDDQNNTRHSKLVETKYLPSLDGVTWSNFEDDDVPNVLDKALQLFFRRARIDFQVLKHPSDPQTKFDLFQRLNRGGAYANEQEVRTCSMVLANPDFTTRIKELAAIEPFQKILKITEDQKLKQKDVEFAVRCIVHTHEDFQTRSDVGVFLDRAILTILFDKESEPTIEPVQWAVNTLYRIFGDSALIPPLDAPEGIAKRFSLRALEAILVVRT